MKSAKYLLSFILLSFVVTSCSDDPASTNEEPPEFPTFENFNPDVTYFEGNISTESPAYMASIYASTVASLSQSGQMYSAYFSDADKDEASYNDGTWVWEYSYNWEGESVTITLESEERTTETYWSMTWSYSGSEQNVENYTVIEGWVSNDGNSGSWQFNTIDDETGEHYPLMITDWEWDSESVGSITTSYYDEDVVTTSYTYEQDGDEFYVTLDSNSEDGNIYIFWVEGSGGYYQEGESEDNRQCWNESYVEVSCS